MTDYINAVNSYDRNILADTPTHLKDEIFSNEEIEKLKEIKEPATFDGRYNSALTRKEELGAFNKIK